MTRIEYRVVGQFAQPFFKLDLICYGNYTAAKDAVIKQRLQIGAQARTLEAMQQQVNALQQSIFSA